MPRSRGGSDGPTVELCASCHQTLHTCAASMKRGRYPARPLAHLSEAGRERLMRLVQCVLASDISGADNPNPMLSVTLDRREYAEALHRYKVDSGCTSVHQAVNLIMHSLAQRYGLVEESTTPRRVALNKLAKNRGI